MNFHQRIDKYILISHHKYIFISALVATYLTFPSIIRGQINPDNTTPTTVQQSDTTWEITGGKTVGNNLFHSFQEFSVPTNNAAFFNNAESVNNIFNRVTGGIPSNIDGLIRANGNANLFLLNPKGIIFGANSALDIGGSLYATTAESILFADGNEFSANQKQEPILKISVPVGLQFGNNPGTIINQSQFTIDESKLGLTVQPNQNIFFVGGDIQIKGGAITTFGGNVELIAVDENSELGITYTDVDLIFDYSSINNFRDIALSQASLIDTSGEGSGAIKLRGNNISLSEASRLQGNTLGNLNGQGIDIQGNTLALDAQSKIVASTFNRGKSSNIDIEVAEFIKITTFSTIESSSKARGNGGNINLNTQKLILEDGSRISLNLDSMGNSGILNIQAEEIQLKEIFTQENEQGEIIDAFASGFIADVEKNGTGQGGTINIRTNRLLLTDGAQISASTFGQGNSGKLNITANSIELVGFSPINLSGLFAAVENGGTGKGGELNVTTERLLLKNGGQIATSTFSEGTAGDLIVQAKSIAIVGSDGFGFPSGLIANVQKNATGNGGKLTVEAETITVQDGGVIATNTLGNGNAEILNINTQFLELRGVATDGRISSILANAVGGNGNGADIFISSDRIIIKDQARIDVGNFDNTALQRSPGTGNPGNLNINANSLSLDKQGVISAATFQGERAGNINIQVAESLTINNSNISNTSEKSSGGTINITAQDIRLQGDSDITTNVFSGAGNGGDITLKADSIVAFDDSDILAFARDGQGGDIILDTPAFFGDSFSLQSDSNNLDNNNRVDLNASGAVFGQISLPDVSFILNSLTELPENIIATDSLLANSCVALKQEDRGSFRITGKGGLPLSPEDSNITPYPIGEIQTLPITKDNPETIIEPEGIYRLKDNRIVLSRRCPKL